MTNHQNVLSIQHHFNRVEGVHSTISSGLMWLNVYFFNFCFLSQPKSYSPLKFPWHNATEHTNDRKDTYVPLFFYQPRAEGVCAHHLVWLCNVVFSTISSNPLNCKSGYSLRLKKRSKIKEGKRESFMSRSCSLSWKQLEFLSGIWKAREKSMRMKVRGKDQSDYYRFIVFWVQSDCCLPWVHYLSGDDSEYCFFYFQMQD